MAQVPIGFLLVKFQDSNAEPITKMFADIMCTATGRGTPNIVDWFDENSHGNVDMTGNVVFDWIQLDHKSTDYMGSGANPTGRQQIFDWARHSAQAAGIDLSPFQAVVVVTNVSEDLFGESGNVCCSSAHVSPWVLCQEMIHGLGVYEHSRHDGSDADYQDPFDVMSLFNAMSANLPAFSGLQMGPGLNAAFMQRCGWLDATRAVSASQVTLRPLHHRDLVGPLYATVGPYFVEYRPRKRWDDGFNSTVLVHYRAKNTSYLVKDLTAGQTFFLGNPTAPIATITVNSIDDGADQATISLQIRVITPIWIGSGQLPGVGMHWTRGTADLFMAADVDGDGREELLAVNNDSGFLGLLRWTGAALAPTWMGSGQIQGAGMHWSRDAADQFVAVSAEQVGRHDFLVANNNNGYLGLLRWTGSALAPVWMGSGRIQGAGMHWTRGADQFFAADVDADQLQELLAVNNTNGFLGLLKWTGGALKPIWIGSGAIPGNGMHWSRSADDRFLIANIDTVVAQAILVINNSNGYIGLLKWTGGALAPIWMAAGQIRGTGMHWSRGTHDQFVAADVDGDGFQEIVVANNDSGYIGVLKWKGTVLAAVWIDVGQLDGIGMYWSRDAADSLAAVADVDGDGQQEIVIANSASGNLGVLKWDGVRLAPVCVGAGRLDGNGIHWSRSADDMFVPANCDGDRQDEILVANNRNGFLGVLKLMPSL